MSARAKAASGCATASAGRAATSAGRAATSVGRAATSAGRAATRARRAKPPQLKSEVQEFKRRRILEETRDLLYVRGYEATTLDAIAAGLHVTKPFIYSYYRNKSEILRAICAVGIRNSLAALDEVLATDLRPREKLRRIVEKVSGIVIDDQKYIVVYEREEKNLEPADARTLMGLRREFGLRIAQLLEAGNRAGEFRVGDPLLTAVAIGGLVTWLASWYRADGRWSRTEVVAHMVESVERLVGASAASGKVFRAGLLDGGLTLPTVAGTAIATAAAKARTAAPRR